MSHASASVVVAPVRASFSRRRGAIALQPTAASSAGGRGLGAGEGMGAPSARLLRARCRRGVVGMGDRRAVMTVRAKTLEERIASGEFTKPRTSFGETLLNGLRDALKSVESPQSESLAHDTIAPHSRRAKRTPSRSPPPLLIVACHSQTHIKPAFPRGPPSLCYPRD